MDRWADYQAWRKRRGENVSEQQDRALAQEARKARETFAATPCGSPGFEVRWSLARDSAGIADVLELNGMPRWVAFEERFIVVEEGARCGRRCGTGW